MDGKVMSKITKENKPGLDNYSFDLKGKEEPHPTDKVDYKALAEEFQKQIYALEKILQSNGLGDLLPAKISDEEFICINGIDTIKMLVFNKIFTKDDINMFDVLYRNLNIIRGIKGSNQKKEKPKSHAELLQLVKKQ
jgi:hypothetical protein